VSVLSRRALLAGALSASALRAPRAEAAAPLASPAALFVSHGSPLYLPLPGNEARREELHVWGAGLAKPRGIVVMTPHFAARRIELGPSARGFAMYDLPVPIKRRLPQDLEYETPSSAELAARLDALLAPRPSNGGSASDRLPRPDRRGFDHTTWMPLRCLFPAADVPVVELGYPYVPEAEAFALGQKLAPLRAEGILFVGSGGMTHNLAVDLGPGAPVPSFSKEFDAWASERLAKHDTDALIDWRAKAPAPFLAHPDDGAHYRVVLVALGFASGAGIGAAGQIAFPITGFEGALSKRCAMLG
jgi:4,5-DOPA dioxygenase extradiol